MGECLVICAHCGKPKYSHGLGTEACPTPGWSVGDPMENRWGDTTFMAIPIPPGMGAEHVLAQEIRSVSSTGAEKGTKLERFDLIPDIPLRMLARHYGVGARKYTRKGLCTCGLESAGATPRFMPSDSADPATSVISSSATPNTLSDNGSTTGNGEKSTGSTSFSGSGHESGSPTSTTTGATASQQMSTRPTSKSPAASAESHLDTSTTITSPGRSGADSATAATSASDISKGGSPSTGTQHLPGCGALTIHSGERNWELGYEWSKSFAALNRHLWAFWGGEDIDGETSMPHMIAVAWHALALVEFSITHPEFDDRPTPSVAEREPWCEHCQCHHVHRGVWNNGLRFCTTCAHTRGRHEQDGPCFDCDCTLFIDSGR